jgi:nucleotide-binding universal stress UspA family protein
MRDKRRILVAIDLEAGTELALEQAIFTAGGGPDTELIALNVIDQFVEFQARPFSGWNEGERLDAVTKRVTAALTQYQRNHPDVRLAPTQVHVTVGRAANEIVWVAAHFDVDLIVVGSHGRRGLSRLLLGSVAEKVVRLAGCPVVVARAKFHDPAAKMAEIEPICDDCATVRRESSGAQLWCPRHSEHHVRAHTYSSAGRTEEPEAWSAATGTR